MNIKFFRIAVFILIPLSLLSCKERVDSDSIKEVSSDTTYENEIPDSLKPLIGIDHINIAVKDLNSTIRLFVRLGFTVKPGRLHDNSIRNALIEFKDGKELELITADEPMDDLAKEYIDLISKGDGSAFTAFYVNSIGKTGNLLSPYYEIIKSKSGNQNTIVFPEESDIRTFWFVEKEKLNPEQQTHTDHNNTAGSLNGVILSKDFEDIGIEFLNNLGIDTVQTSDGDYINSFLLNDGYIHFSDKVTGSNGRPITGVIIKVSDYDKCYKVLKQEAIPFSEKNGNNLRRLIISEDFTGSIDIVLEE